ncbi:hypothetical protein A1O3_00452 [Capronia epimyces CBS 606.96]|uniref:Heterokaryon incompatibility domain-containing protein n=1 Tax=Capronia epimyces CBS 606.96 TaxID=1182542 RepID=W9YGB1_9EURO|nr:uncharacterized protein A1O3_00452 [Capronia epimyces CBS 606.96]EXJ91902.1 hypothetical protein A1O3_00452 [Capronia epimyces CBS 606.96]
MMSNCGSKLRDREYEEAQKFEHAPPDGPGDIDDDDFWIGPDRRWEEQPVEQLITYMGNVENYYFYGQGQDLVDRDLSALTADGDSFPDLLPNRPNLAVREPGPDVSDASLPLIPSYLHSSGILQERSMGGNDATIGLYQALPSDEHIRLLEIVPGDCEQIECRLHVVALAEAKDTFEALSYSWDCGTPEYSDTVRTHLIICNGFGTVVRHNLYSALKKMRRKSASRMVWADALSINQADLVERSHQVTLMNSIFKSAYRVYIWLGENGANDNGDNMPPSTVRLPHRAFSDVCRIVNAWRKLAGLVDQVPIAKCTPQLPTQRSDSEIDKPLRASWSEWCDVLTLFRCRWFHRLWVIQEAAVARSALVAWGDCEIAWEWVGLAAAILRTNYGRLRRETSALSAHEAESRAVPTGVLNAYFMYRVSESQRYFTPLRFSLSQLLSLTRQFDCQDDRDRVYGLLGIPMTDNASKNIVPDYNKSSTEVYIELAQEIIRHSLSLNLLSSVQRHYTSFWDHYYQPREQDFDENAPSWVPQWHVVFAQTLALLSPHPSFAASAREPVKVRSCAESTKLTLRGVILDRISAFERSNFRDFWRGERPSEFWGRHRVVESLETILKEASLTKRKIEGIAMTITGGKNWYGLPVQDLSIHLADFAKCLLKEGLVWSLKMTAFGSSYADSSNDWETIRSDDSDKELAPRWIKPGDLSIGSASTSSSDIVTLEVLEELSRGGNADRFLDATATTCVRRARFTTGSGLIGVGPEALVVNDLVCVLYGGDVPFIIRPKGTAFELIGECYIRDLMHGEAVEMLARPGCEIEETWIELV